MSLPLMKYFIACRNFLSYLGNEAVALTVYPKSFFEVTFYNLSWRGQLLWWTSSGGMNFSCKFLAEDNLLSLGIDLMIRGRMGKVPLERGERKWRGKIDWFWRIGLFWCMCALFVCMALTLGCHTGQISKRGSQGRVNWQCKFICQKGLLFSQDFRLSPFCEWLGIQFRMPWGKRFYYISWQGRIIC